MKRFLWFPLLLLLLAACDPMAPQPTPVAVIVSPLPSATHTPRPTATPTPTPTLTPTPTDVLFPSSTPSYCGETEGQVIEFRNFVTEQDNENLRYLVYVPPCYILSQKRFPVVVLFHGLSYREQQWGDIGVMAALDQGIALGLLPPMILVMPYFGTLGQLNSFPPDTSFESYVVDELLPAVERDFCTVQERDYRGIGGISRGGFWAYSVAFRHPDLFGVVGGHSAYFPESLAEVPAPFNPLEIAVNSQILLGANLRMYLDNAAADSSGVSIQRLSDRLKERQIPHTYVINPIGAHDNEYWSAHVSEYLEFYGREWPRDYEALPDCG